MSGLIWNCLKLMVFLKEFFKKKLILKKSGDKKSMKNYPGSKELTDLAIVYSILGNKVSYEVKSSMLRRFFLSTDEDKNILPSDDEELMVHESSSKIIMQTVKSGTPKTTPKSARKAEMKPHSLKSTPKSSPKTVAKSGVKKSNQQKSTPNQQKSTPKIIVKSPVDSNSELSPLTKNKKRLSTPLTNRKSESKKEMLKVNRSLKRTKSKQTL